MEVSTKGQASTGASGPFSLLVIDWHSMRTCRARTNLPLPCWVGVHTTWFSTRALLFQKLKEETQASPSQDIWSICECSLASIISFTPDEEGEYLTSHLTSSCAFTDVLLFIPFRSCSPLKKMIFSIWLKVSSTQHLSTSTRVPLIVFDASWICFPVNSRYNA